MFSKCQYLQLTKSAACLLKLRFNNYVIIQEDQLQKYFNTKLVVNQIPTQVINFVLHINYSLKMLYYIIIMN